MKKFLTVFSFVLSISILSAFSFASQGISFAAASEQAIKSVEVSDGDVDGIAALYGKGDNYMTDIYLQVQFDGYDSYEISLEDGYSPSIDVFDFGGDDNLLFCSSQTGGSGGYGNYRVYRLRTQTYQLIYDDEIDSRNASFGAEFIPGGFMRLKNEATDYSLKVDVGYMDKDFYDMIFASDGSLKGEEPYVNAISFVSPALNSAVGLWRLITYRSVAAVAEVNRLGYIVQTLDFDGNAFIPTYTEFAIRL